MWIIPYTFDFTFYNYYPQIFFYNIVTNSVCLLSQFFWVPTMKLMDKKIGLIFMLKKYVTA